MNRRRRPLRSLATYVLLVLPPLAILFAILHAGRDLVAPRSIGGHWTLELPGAATDRCTLAATTLDIEQSGPRAQASLRGAGGARTLWLQVAGDDVRGATRRDLEPCSALALSARLGARDELTGTLSRPSCDACPATAFRAVRARGDRTARP